MRIEEEFAGYEITVCNAGIMRILQECGSASRLVHICPTAGRVATYFEIE